MPLGGRPRRAYSRVPATVIVGAQWGDEGKGKIVDLLARDSDLVCRYNGGPNAGHTIIADGETYKIRHMPSGILWGKECVIGAGCVVDPGVFIEELEDFESRGISTDLVRLSGNAHVIMPWHLAIDQAGERRLGKLQIGTTRRGIGPTYADKAYRLGIRLQDLFDPKILRQKIEVALAEKNVWLDRVYGVEPIELEELAARYEGYAQRLRPYLADTSLLVDRAIREGKQVLLEGAHGTLLDIDHGTYPFVTSSPTLAGGACTGLGIGPTRIDSVIGVAKAYVTRVGAGPFPTEIEGPDQDRMRELGGEFGTVTGRERRCGWLDLVALRYAVRLNGITSIALTKLDVLAAFDQVPVCTAYELRDGTRTDEFPEHQSDFHAARPVYEELDGWGGELDGGELPDAARRYVEFVEQAARRRGVVGRNRRRARAGARPLATSMARFFLPAVSALVLLLTGCGDHSSGHEYDARATRDCLQDRPEYAGSLPVDARDGSYANRHVRVRHPSLPRGAVRRDVRSRRDRGNRAGRPLLRWARTDETLSQLQTPEPVLLSGRKERPSGVSGSDRAAWTDQPASCRARVESRYGERPESVGTS